jgi:hypothetical protein
MTALDSRSTDPPAPAPRLGIAHLLCWIAGCAVTLAVSQYAVLNQQIAPQDQTYHAVSGTVAAMAYGAALAGLLFIGWSRWRGDRSLPRLPGHWLLLLAAVVALLDAACTFGFQFLAQVRGVSFYAYWSPYHAVGHGCGLLVAIGFLVLVPLPWMWRIAIASLGLLCGGQFLWHLLLVVGSYETPASGPISRLFAWLGPSLGYLLGDHLMAGLSALGAVALLAACLHDIVRRRPGDWIHYTGIAAFLAMAGIQVAGYLRYTAPLVWPEPTTVVAQ